MPTQSPEIKANAADSEEENTAKKAMYDITVFIAPENRKRPGRIICE